jgi:hypothetical protein
MKVWFMDRRKEAVKDFVHESWYIAERVKLLRIISMKVKLFADAIKGHKNPHIY